MGVLEWSSFLTQDVECESSDFEVDYDLFYESYWATLAHRIPAFECLKVSSVSRNPSRKRELAFQQCTVKPALSGHPDIVEFYTCQLFL